jgi:hypothetical protein
MPSTRSIKHTLVWTIRIATLPLIVYPIFIQADSALTAVFIVPALAIFIVWQHLSAPLRIRQSAD